MTHFQQILVWKQNPAGRQQRVGTVRVKAPDPLHGGLVGAFRYDPRYLAEAGAFPLDPLHLPLSPEVFEAHRLRAGVHGVFEDALPDEWGRALLVRRHDLPSSHQRVPDLLRVLGGEGLGALSFGEHKGAPPRKDTSAAFRDLEFLVQAAERYEQSGALPSDPVIRPLLQAGSSPGGVRPKALVRDDTVFYIAKFPSAKDPVGVDMVRVEAASLALAREAGIETPESRVVLCGSRPILLSRRFDVSDHGHYHQISLQSLMGVDGYYNESYMRVADVVRRVSDVPDRDLMALYRRIVFHAVLGHTDDHLKNILMRHDGHGYRLAPAFDLAPDVFQRADHVLSFGGTSGTRPSRAALVDLGADCGLSPAQAHAIRAEVVGAVKRWDEVFAQEGISVHERSRYAPDLEERLRVVNDSALSAVSIPEETGVPP